MMKTIPEGKVKHTQFKPTGHNNRLETKFSFGLILIDIMGFSIYSKITNELLYNWDGGLNNYECSENSIIFQRPDYSYRIMTFKHSLIPREEIKCIEEKCILSCDYSSCFEFKYPFFAIHEVEKDLKLFDVQSGKDMIKENGIVLQRSQEFKRFTLSKQYLVILEYKSSIVKSLLVFKTLYMNEKPYEITTYEYSDFYLSNNMLFIYYPSFCEHSITIECHDLNTRKVTNIDVPHLHIRSIDHSFINAFASGIFIRIYEWNSNFTKLRTLIDLDPGKNLLECFTKLLPFYVLSEIENGLFILRVYSKIDKKMLIECKVIHNVDFITDGISKIYYRYYSGGEPMIGIIDFHC